jgi:CelD/BcsL family acetyltransferase involved in cellulose biosynthesis
LEPLPDRDVLAVRWQALEQSAKPSIFLSWAWIGTLLRTSPTASDGPPPELLTVRRNGRDCGLAVLFRSKQWRHGWLGVNGLYLHETGVPVHDSLTIEYNGFLAAPEDQVLVAETAIRFLADEVTGWDEFHLSGIDRALGYEDIAVAVGLRPHILNVQPCDYVDLDAVRAIGGDYLAALSRNTRYQIRRALRRYGEFGAVEARLAGTVEEAMDFLNGLKVLHQAYWTERNHPGAFANPFFEAFHATFIRDRFAAGEIQLVRITAGDFLIGYLYNFFHAGHVYAYQSGFNYSDGAALKPGLTSHCLALEQAMVAGARVYDFLAGEAQYKRSLGTRRRELVWIAARRPRLKYRIEDCMRKVKHLADLVLRRQSSG